MVLSLWKGDVGLTSMRSIMDAVCADYGVTEDQLRTVAARGVIGDARQDFMWRCRQPMRGDQCLHSFPKIARFIGLGDHTSVCHAVRRHEARMAERLVAA